MCHCSCVQMWVHKGLDHAVFCIHANLSIKKWIKKEVVIFPCKYVTTLYSSKSFQTVPKQTWTPHLCSSGPTLRTTSYGNHKSMGCRGGRGSLIRCSLRKYLQAEWWGSCLTGGCFLLRTPWTPDYVSVWWMCLGGPAGGGYPPDGPTVGWLGRRKSLGWWTQCGCGPCGVSADCPGLWTSLYWFPSLY